MRPIPAEEWQRLTKLYSEMSDGQLLELAETYSDLTEIAQPILRDEMKKRGLDEPIEILQPPVEPSASRPTFASFAPRFSSREPSPEDTERNDDEIDAVEYTWKTELCTCETKEEAWQIGEVLRLAGIESWLIRPGESFGTRSVPSLEVQILVAADQLDEARAVIARPIPQDIVDQSKVRVEDFDLPKCPKCGAPDPVLESVDPVNTWSCEICGATWSDSAVADTAPSEPVS
jgi:ribosomal protein L37AE/L43A